MIDEFDEDERQYVMNDDNGLSIYKSTQWFMHNDRMIGSRVTVFFQNSLRTKKFNLG